MSKPIKPSVTIPAEFAPNGVRTPFSNAKVQDGFDRINPDVFAGDNLNQFIDDTYKASNYALDLGDYVLGHDQIPPVITNAPNGVFTNSGNSITVKQGLRLTLPNGVNTDGTLNNTEYEVSEDVTQTISPVANATTIIFFAPNEPEGNKIIFFAAADYYIQDTEPFTPATGLYGIWFSRKDNKIRYSLNGSAWTDYLAIAIGTVKTNSNGNVTNIYPYVPIRIPDVSMVDGQWVKSGIAITESVTYTANQSVTYDISSHLPNDNYDYEVMFSAYIRTGATSGNAVGCVLYSGSSTSNINARLGRCVTRTNQNVNASGNGILPILHNDRNVTWVNSDAEGTSGGCGLRMIAYRRIGTNE